MTDTEDAERREAPRITRTTMDEVADIVATPPGPARDEAVEHFISRRMPLWARWARSLCRTCSVPTGQYFDDVQQIVTVAAWDLLARAISDPEVLHGVITFEAICFRHARARVRSFTDKAVTPASGMTTAMRRHRKVQESRSRLRARFNREPTDAEAVDEANRMLEHLQDQKGQGMHITMDDVSSPTEMADPETALDAASHVDFDEGFILHPVEARSVVARVVRACQAADETLGQVARLWMAEIYSTDRAGHGADTVAFIAEQTGLRRPRVRGLIEEVRVVAIGVLRDIGIDPGEGV